MVIVLKWEGTAGSPRNPKNRKIYLHWSGGFHNSPSGRYHQIFGGSGQPLNPPANYGVDKFEHTGGANTDSVGLAVAAMGHRGMTQTYYDEKKGWAENPPTSSQINAIAKEAAGIMRAYGQTAADVNKNVMTHGEWERQGVKSGALSGTVQRWDLDSLTPPGPNGYGHPGGFYSTTQVRSKGGDALRSKIRSFLGGGSGETSEETPRVPMKLEKPDGMKQEHFEMFGSMDADHRGEIAAAQIGSKVHGLTVTTEIRAEVKRYNLALTKHSQMMAKNPQEDGGGSTAAITSAGARQAPGPRVTPNVDAFLLPGSGGVPKNATPTSSAAGGGKNVVPNFSSTDGMNTETLIIKSIYNMVG